MRALTPHHTSLLALRSHQWKWVLDTYSGCGFGCVYCSSEMSTCASVPRPVEGVLASLDADLDEVSQKGIVFVGPVSDPYQPLESEARITRGALEMLLRHEMPVVVLTKSPLILRDQDLLLELHRRGLVMVQFTLVSLDEDVVDALEPSAPPPRARLRAAATLSGTGIPVHVHVSPYAAGLHRHGTLKTLVSAIADYGGRVVYTNHLGVRGSRHEVVRAAYGRLGGEAESAFTTLYGGRPGSGVAIRLPDSRRLVAEMERFRELCLARELSFVCEFIPGLTVLRPGELRDGVFRFSLPAVYQMVPFWDGADDRCIDWTTFARDFMAARGVRDEEYLGFVESLWRSGELFTNTTLRSRRGASATCYQRTDTLRIDDRSCRRLPGLIGRMGHRAWRWTARRMGRRGGENARA